MNQCVQWRQGKAKRKSQELTEAIQIDDIEIFERVVATSRNYARCPGIGGLSRSGRAISRRRA